MRNSISSQNLHRASALARARYFSHPTPLSSALLSGLTADFLRSCAGKRRGSLMVAGPSGQAYKRAFQRPSLSYYGVEADQCSFKVGKESADGGGGLCAAVELLSLGRGREGRVDCA